MPRRPSKAEQLLTRQLASRFPDMCLEVRIPSTGEWRRGTPVEALGLLASTIGRSRALQEAAVMTILNTGHMDLTPRTRMVINGY